LKSEQATNIKTIKLYKYYWNLEEGTTKFVLYIST